MNWWAWNDPAWFLTFSAVVIAFATLVFTILIPLALKKSTDKSQEVLNELQQQNLSYQKDQKFYVEFNGVASANSKKELELYVDSLSSGSYTPTQREVMIARLIDNKYMSVPGAPDTLGIKFSNDLTNSELETVQRNIINHFSKLPGNQTINSVNYFISLLKRRGVDVNYYQFGEIVSTYIWNESNRIGHLKISKFFEKNPESIPAAISTAGSSNSLTSGQRIQILTSVFYALFIDESIVVENTQLKHNIALEIATILNGPNYLIPHDSTEVSYLTEPISATLAWGIKAIGIIAGSNNYYDMRIIQNLNEFIKTCAQWQVMEQKNYGLFPSKGFGVDRSTVDEGIDLIKSKSSKLWKLYGKDIENALIKF